VACWFRGVDHFWFIVVVRKLIPQQRWSWYPAPFETRGRREVNSGIPLPLVWELVTWRELVLFRPVDRGKQLIGYLIILWSILSPPEVISKCNTPCHSGMTDPPTSRSEPASHTGFIGLRKTKLLSCLVVGD
jgi:hypothetical protein